MSEDPILEDNIEDEEEMADAIKQTENTQKVPAQVETKLEDTAKKQETAGKGMITAEKKMGENVKQAHPVEKITEVTKTVGQELDTIDNSGEELLKFFDKVGTGVETLATMVASLDKQPHDQARVEALVKYVKEWQAWNEHMYNLLVEMHNFFGGKWVQV